MQYKQLNYLLHQIDQPNRDACLKLWEDNKERFSKAPGSLSKHQAWEGGYIGHLEEVMNFGINLFTMMDITRKLDFTISDIILVLFLHDLEKPFRYIDPKLEFKDDQEKHAFIYDLMLKYQITLNDIQINALDYIHGEGDAYSRTERIQKPLAAFVHMCDVASARIWFDFPRKS